MGKRCTTCGEVSDTRFCPQCGSALPETDPMLEANVRVTSASATKAEHLLPHFTAHENNRRLAWGLAETAFIPGKTLLWVVIVFVVAAGVWLVALQFDKGVVRGIIVLAAFVVALLALMVAASMRQERAVAAYLRRLSDNPDPMSQDAHHLDVVLKQEQFRKRIAKNVVYLQGKGILVPPSLSGAAPDFGRGGRRGP